MNAHPEPDLLAGLNATIAQALAPHLHGSIEMRRARYVSALLRADWSFEQAEGNAWRRGRDELQRLRAEQAEVDPDGALWRRHAPAEFHNHLQQVSA